MFSNRLKVARKDANLTLEQLAELYNQKFDGVGLNKSTLSKYENARQKPMGDVISRIAEILNVSTDYLLGKTSWKTQEERWSASPDEVARRLAEEKARMPPEERYAKYPPTNSTGQSETIRLGQGVVIPVIGEVAAGTPIFAEENYIGYEEISEETAMAGEFFGLKIKGDSMSPRILEGDTVIVKKQEDAKSGDVVIVLINGEEATCKRIVKYQEGINLISFNPSYKPMSFTNKDISEKPIQIIGKIVENRQKY